ARQGRRAALRPGLRPVCQGQGHHPGAHLSRDHRGSDAQREQGADRQERGRTGRAALSAAARAEVQPVAQGAGAALGAGPASGRGRHAMSNRSIGLLVAAAVFIFLLTQTFYTVDPTKQVLVRQFGALIGDPKTEPGLYLKIPLVQDVLRIDRRLLDYEADEFEIIAGDQKRLVVDAYARYRIINARQFAETVPGGEPMLRGILDSL